MSPNLLSRSFDLAVTYFRIRITAEASAVLYKKFRYILHRIYAERAYGIETKHTVGTSTT